MNKEDLYALLGLGIGGLGGYFGQRSLDKRRAGNQLSLEDQERLAKISAGIDPETNLPFGYEKPEEEGPGFVDSTKELVNKAIEAYNESDFNKDFVQQQSNDPRFEAPTPDRNLVQALIEEGEDLLFGNVDYEDLGKVVPVGNVDEDFYMPAEANRVLTTAGNIIPQSTAIEEMAGLSETPQGDFYIPLGGDGDVYLEGPALESDLMLSGPAMDQYGREVVDNPRIPNFIEYLTGNELLSEQGKLQDAIDAAGGWELERKLEVAADALRLPPWDADVSTLSGGERRRVALCRLLLASPDMLLLDEPTNHLDAESVAWIERFLSEYSGTVIAVTHDRYFLDNVAGWILELDRGYGIPWEGNYSSWLEQKDQRLKIEESRQAAHQKTIKAELDWVKSNPKARHAKSKARMQRFEELSSKDFQERNETNEIYIAPGERLGDKVIILDRISKGFGSALLIKDLSLSIPKGSVVGIIGGNGTGKSTLFRMIAGSEKPDSGSIIIGDTVKIAFVEQTRDSLCDDQNVWEAISGGQDVLRVGNYEVSSRAYAGRFNFKGSDQQKRVGDLSGGERGRLHLANTLKQGANVLLLDEPSNDLDIETLRALEEAILSFPGCVLVISHDRWFLDRIATHTLAYEDDGEIIFFEGCYSAYHDDLVERKGSEIQPSRIKHKRLKR